MVYRTETEERKNDQICVCSSSRINDDSVFFFLFFLVTTSTIVLFFSPSVLFVDGVSFVCLKKEGRIEKMSLSFRFILYIIQIDEE